MTVNYLYIVGVTCTGKDYLMDFMESQDPTIGSVRVGKILRERYPPDHFKGSGAPEHTEKEALEIFESEIQRLKGKRTVLISGQPRRLSQIKPTIGKYKGSIIWLHASDDVIRQRISNRSEADQELALQRIKNDKIDLYTVMHELWCQQDIPIHSYNTGVMSVQQLYGELTLVL